MPDWQCSTAPVEDLLAWQILHDMHLQNRRSDGFRLHARHSCSNYPTCDHRQRGDSTHRSVVLDSLSQEDI